MAPDKTTNKIMIVSDDMIPEEMQVDARIKALIVSFEGQLPGSRGFGLARRFLSRAPREAINIFAIELQEKVRKYIPGINIAGVEGEIAMDGQLDLIIHIERSGA